jgi:A/G-specific adenine glycosylase
MMPLDATTMRAVRRALLRWHRIHGLRAPWRETGDPYHALVAAVMAQQTQMSRVMPSYDRFVAAFPTVEALATATPAEVIRAWEGMGYNQRAVRLHRAARAIMAHGWPRTVTGLTQLDGVGSFTAAIVASFAFRRPAACVDTNVRRVLGRIAGDEQMPPRQLQALADAWVSRARPARWNQAVMDYGARVCTPRPRCGECVVAGSCASRAQFAGASARRPRRTRRQQPRFEESDRYYRGRIVDLLRRLPRGRSLRPRTIAQRLAVDASSAAGAARLERWLRDLARDGLVVVSPRGVALP